MCGSFRWLDRYESKRAPFFLFQVSVNNSSGGKNDDDDNNNNVPPPLEFVRDLFISLYTPKLTVALVPD